MYVFHATISGDSMGVVCCPHLAVSKMKMLLNNPGRSWVQTASLHLKPSSLKPIKIILYQLTR